MILNPVFCDDMILQAEEPARIFGKGVGLVTAEIGSEKIAVNAENGTFLLELPPQKYGAVLDITLSDEKSQRVLHRVLFGDVYVFSGQSNMAFKLSAATPDGAVYESDEIRFFATEDVRRLDRFSPKNGWVSVTKDTAHDVSAVAYFTARELHKAKKRPIGVITAHCGASIIESWISEEVLKTCSVALPQNELFPDHYMEEYAKWNRGGVLYDLDIAPLLPLALKGVVWYQGESNCGDGEAVYYDRYLSALITSWRTAFCETDLPFVVVQLADFEGRDFPAWHEIQKRQETVCNTLSNCRLAKSRDISETDDIHPPTKHLLAKRIAELL